ncbi:hypothetical protein Desca_0612 [Desulfotomaculum nigrificans CO-1-SRB]|uniref:Uncharacterized protein n=1 Tax=Desulfotomaculum nigrificans (strain DSM 14880 / VKM B-2319 / CO-1-SRB) TaxID=868595 RepID=F6B857_DESCC|nr:hypothetical protein [Desulfotomaculum nigrificans]AEF93502.1 hypothetical protein Desca_0612 [Desulfotomaculum nigrificans CO-1-SRB]
MRKKYRMKKRLKIFLSLIMLTSLGVGGYYISQNYNLPLLRPAMGAKSEKPQVTTQFIDTSGVYLYDRRFENGNIIIRGMVLNPGLQYKASEFRVMGQDVYIRITVEPNPDKKIKEFGFKIPYDPNKVKKVYLQGSSANDKWLVWPQT